MLACAGGQSGSSLQCLQITIRRKSGCFLWCAWFFSHCDGDRVSHRFVAVKALGRARDEPHRHFTGAILGLVSFLLAFPFGFAASNYSDRRSTVLEEANAIGTAYLRADLLPELEASEMRRLLRQYTEMRVAVTEPGVTIDGFFIAIRQSETIHLELWSLVAGIAKADPSPTNSLVVASVNDLIDLHAKRIAVGVRHAIPFTIWISLFLVSTLALGATVTGSERTSANGRSFYRRWSLPLPVS